MSVQTRTNLESLVIDLSARKISALKKSIQEEQITKSTDLFELRSKLHLTGEETSLVKSVLDDFDDLNSMLLSIELMSEIQKLRQINEQSNSLVWTSPFVFNEDADNTKTTLLDMIYSAKKSIIIVGYTIERDTKEIFAALEHASQKGVSVKLLFDNATKFAPIVEKLWESKGTLPHLYSYKPQKKNSSLHAKVMIVDGKELLITSANLTGRGISRNVEIGIRHKGNSAKSAEKLVKTLIRNGYLVKI